LFLFTLFLSVFKSPDQFLTIAYIITLTISLFLAYSFSSSLNDEELRKALIIYSYFATFILVIYSIFAGYDINGRLSGVFNPNTLGMIAVSVICTSFLLHNKFLIYIVAFPSFIVLFLTNSRLSMASLAVFLIVFYLLSKKKLPNIFTVAFILLLFSFIFFFHQFFSEQFVTIFALYDPWRGLDSGGTGRTFAWINTIYIFLSSPVVGVGYRMHHKFMILPFSSAHNGYLSMLADTGILGFSISVYFIISSIINYMNNLNNSFSAWAFSMICVYLFIAFFEKVLFNTGNPLSLLALVLMMRGFMLKKQHNMT
jgi:O-antigen ligase